MLFAWQIGTLSTSLAVQDSTVLSYCLYKTGDPTENSKKDKVPDVGRISKLDSGINSLLYSDLETLQQKPYVLLKIQKVLNGFDFIIKDPKSDYARDRYLPITLTKSILPLFIRV
ncbi:hypothetical protein IX38_04330 [Chryseobacterium luteum]|uniref:Uncharacterized protein n=2 Tax=Chryseobacterium luteum TaxID=421531 RepID=A0A085ZW61_9FLAO|nr:hypothetical protein IX38_04330 [Chryseobacterium luteum]